MNYEVGPKLNFNSGLIPRLKVRFGTSLQSMDHWSVVKEGRHQDKKSERTLQTLLIYDNLWSARLHGLKQHSIFYDEPAI